MLSDQQENCPRLINRKTFLTCTMHIWTRLMAQIDSLINAKSRHFAEMRKAKINELGPLRPKVTVVYMPPYRAHQQDNAY